MEKEEKRQTILMVTNSHNFVAIPMTEQLEESYVVITVKPQIQEVQRVRERVDLVLLFSDESFSRSESVLVYLKDWLMEHDLKALLIGDKEDNRVVEKWIPERLLEKKINRPVDVKQTISFINYYLSNFGKNNKKKILVVDDSGAMLRNVKAWLENYYDVILANSGAMAIKYLAISRPDLVLLDYEMPVVDGKQVLEMIRSESEFANIPVIFLTGKDDRKSVLDVMSLKPEGYLLKTMPPERIIREIDHFFERRKGL